MTFHDGEPFNAEAVCYNFERMFDQNEAGQVAGEYWGYVMGAFANDADNSLYQGCEATGEFEAVVSINGPTSGFPTMLTLESLSMQSPKALEEGDANGIAAEGEGFSFPAYANSPVGTGPFTFGEYDEANGEITPRAQRRLLGRAAKVSEIVFRVIPDESTRRQELEAGSINGYDLPNPVDWAALEEDGNTVEVRDAVQHPLPRAQPRGQPAAQDLKVRQAIYHALNREQLVQTQLPEGADGRDAVHARHGQRLQHQHRALRLRPRRGQEAARRGRRGRHDARVRLPHRGHPPLHAGPREDLRGAAHGPGGGRHQGEGRDGLLERRLPRQRVRGRASTTPTSSGWTGDYDSAFNFIGTFFGNLKENDFGTDAMPWGKQLADDLKAADAIVDEAERGAAFEEINAQIMEEYLPGLPISHSPPALVVGPGVEGVDPQPADGRGVRHRHRRR